MKLTVLLSSYGVQSSGMTLGFPERERLEHGNPFAIADSSPELQEAMHKFFSYQQKHSNIPRNVGMFLFV